MRRILLTMFALMTVTSIWAQVTTSSLKGTVNDGSGAAVPGATIVAVHEPSGSTFGTSAQPDGHFIIPGMRVGGPYKVTISFIGFGTQTYGDIYLKLGEAFVLNSVLTEEATTLGEVVVFSTTDKSIYAEKTGAATNLSNQQIMSSPTISRSITDFTRFTPQSNGNSFAGRDGRYNNIQVDGANLNNNFGLSSDPLPGGGNNPVSLDAYEEISVNIAPYDVRQAGFTGAGINAVTKSGTNTFKGTAYTFWRNQNYLGTNVGSNDISKQITDSKNNIYGFSVGGPIIKNKLFFFVNSEFEKGSRPGITYSPTGGSGVGNISSTPIDSLKKLSDYLDATYGYKTGAYDHFPNFENRNVKLLAKIDYNINQDHKLTFKFSSFKSTNDQPLNGSSIPNSGGYSVIKNGTPKTISRLPVNRFSNASMSYANSNYGFEDIVRTGTLELNSSFGGGKMSNQFLTTLTKIHTTRTFDGDFFPTVDIFNGNGDNYISFGMDPFTPENDVINDIYSVIDNFTYYSGKHTITGGVSFEFQKVGNRFMPGSNSAYAYSSLDDFIKDRPPIYYAYTFSLVPGEKYPYSANLKIGQLGVYAQDEYNISDNLKVIAGVRIDKPIYTEDPLENPAATALNLYNEDGKVTHYNTGMWPKSSILWSPRVGVKWNVLDDKSLIVRGGTGLFTGRIPFVFLTNMPTNSGMYQYSARLRNSNGGENAILGTMTFNPDPDAYASLFTTTPGATPNSSGMVFIDKNFKFPQVWRTNLGIDKKLPYGITATLEALFTKDVNAVKMRNANFKPDTDGVVTEGGKSRPRYLSAGSRNENASISNAIVLENTKKGYSTAITLQLTKSFDKGLYASIAYTYSKAEEVTANPGSQASSVWNSNPNVGTSNAVELASSQYAIPNRVIANVSYRREYLKHFASTLSLFYEGQNQGRFSYVVSGDLNGDGNSSTDLMYIPKKGEMNFVAYSTFTVADQEAAFEKFIKNSDYLSKHRGEYAGRNAALLPWYNRLDLRFLQDFYIVTGQSQTKHTLQFSVDILNFGNMLNKDWGVRNSTLTTNPLSLNAITGDVPSYTWQNIGGKLVTKPFQDIISPSSTWSLQLGLRYTF